MKIKMFQKFVYLFLQIFFLSGLLMANEREGTKDFGKHKLATFAGGCFWCLQHTFNVTQGVISTTVGFSGGKEDNPTYQQVANGLTSHLESIQVVYDPEIVNFKLLLHNFFLEHDPYDDGGQFCDRGDHYRPAAFYHDKEQEQTIHEYIAKLEKSNLVKTRVLPYKNFFPAEEYHQDFYKKNPNHYNRYREGCGRDERLKEIWGSEKETRKK